MPFATGELNKMLDAITGRASYTANTAVWAKLHTADPGTAGTTAPATSTTRKQVTWTAAASAAISNSAAVSWTGGDLTTSETITHVSYWTASTAGTYLGSAALNASAAVTAGETLTFATGELDMVLTSTAWAVGELNKALDAWAGTATYTANTAVFVRWHTGDPGASGTANNSSDATRVAATFGTAAASGSISNTAAVTWSTLTLTGPETLSWLSLWTASSGGTFLGRDDLAAGRAVVNGDGISIPIGSLTLALA